jgi:hypothetical protein
MFKGDFRILEGNRHIRIFWFFLPAHDVLLYSPPCALNRSTNSEKLMPGRFTVSRVGIPCGIQPRRLFSRPAIFRTVPGAIREAWPLLPPTSCLRYPLRASPLTGRCSDPGAIRTLRRSRARLLTLWALHNYALHLKANSLNNNRENFK